MVMLYYGSCKVTSCLCDSANLPASGAAFKIQHFLSHLNVKVINLCISHL